MGIKFTLLDELGSKHVMDNAMLAYSSETTNKKYVSQNMTSEVIFQEKAKIF